jgi:hypothetical protein
VWLRPTRRIVSSADRVAFRAQLFACIRECDHRWPSERFWKTGHELGASELAAYPLLAHYLSAIKLWPIDGEQWKENWITFPARVNAFDRETMARPLRDLVARKTAHYGASRMGFDDLSLLLIYNRAAVYNSPPETPFHSIDDAVAEVKRVIGNNRGPFDRVLLYMAVRPGERVLQVC